MDYKIRHVFNGTYDVFIGEGWENWTRININRERCFIVNGKRLPISILKAVHSDILSLRK